MKIGDVVRLKSGGPKMVISEDLTDSGLHYCKWFSEQGDLKSNYFKPTELFIVLNDGQHTETK